MCKTPSWMPDDVQEVDRAVRFPRFRPAFLAEVADAVPPQSGSQSGSRIRLAATAGAGRESAGTRGQLVELLAEGVPGALQLGAHQ